MAELVDSTEIEGIVGIARDPARHYARAVSAEQTVYVLHSAACLRYTPDLRLCGFSRALDAGISLDEWRGHEDRPVLVVIAKGRLVPCTCEVLDLGIDEAAIARATARPMERVRQATAAAGLKKTVARQASKLDLDLEDLAALAEFQGDKQAVDRILQESQYGRTRHAVEQLRQERDEAAAVAERRAALESKGVVVLDERPGYNDRAKPLFLLYGQDGKTLTAGKHRKCPGHAVVVHFAWSGSGRKLGEQAYCLDPKGNGHATSRGGGDRDEPSEEQRAERRELLRRNKEMAAAEKVRREFIRSVIATAKPARDLAPWALERIVHCDPVVARWLEEACQWGEPKVIGELIGVENGAIAELRKALPVRHTLLVWVLVVAAYEARFAKDTWKYDTNGRHGRYLAHLVTLGYTPCETEQQMIDAAAAGEADGPLLAADDEGHEAEDLDPDFDEHPDWQDEG